MRSLVRTLLRISYVIAGTIVYGFGIYSFFSTDPTNLFEYVAWGLVIWAGFFMLAQGLAKR